MVDFRSWAGSAALWAILATTQALPTRSLAADLGSPLVFLNMDRQLQAVQTALNTTTTPGNTSCPDVIRGANIGGWLVLEKWMTSDLFDDDSAVDQYTFDTCSGSPAKLQNHWDTYFTEADVKILAGWGINTLRIPVGYWAYSLDTTPYLRGADEYLEKAIGWCREYGLKVLVDCHGSPGGQNGFDNSGRSGIMEWQQNDNLNKSTDILQTMAKKYGSQAYADVVWGLELTNEPASWGNNSFSVTKQWTQDAFNAVKAAATNKDLKVIMHNSFLAPGNWSNVASAINGGATGDDAPFVLDTHLYQNQVESDSYLNQDQHIAKACGWAQTELPSSSNLPVIVGEFSAQTNICAYSNGTTAAGSICDEDGCQCSTNVPMKYWSQPLKDATRKFFEAQMETFEQSAKGWFVWSYKAPGSWGLSNLMEYVMDGNSSKVTDRKYANQCADLQSY